MKSEFTWPIKYIKVNYFLVMGMVGDFMERLISAFIVLLMVGCGGGSDGSTDSEVSGINDIVGLWDASEERDEGRDEIIGAFLHLALFLFMTILVMHLMRGRTATSLRKVLDG